MNVQNETTHASSSIKSITSHRISERSGDLIVFGIFQHQVLLTGWQVSEPWVNPIIKKYIHQTSIRDTIG